MAGGWWWLVAVQCTGRLAAGDWPGLVPGCLTPMATTAPPRPATEVRRCDGPRPGQHQPPAEHQEVFNFRDGRGHSGVTLACTAGPWTPWTRSSREVDKCAGTMTTDIQPPVSAQCSVAAHLLIVLKSIRASAVLCSVAVWRLVTMSWLPVARYHGTTRGRQHGAGAGSTPLHCTGHTEAAHTHQHQHCLTLILLVTKLAITQHLHPVPKAVSSPQSSWILSTSLH